MTDTTFPLPTCPVPTAIACTKDACHYDEYEECGAELRKFYAQVHGEGAEYGVWVWGGKHKAPCGHREIEMAKTVQNRLLGVDIP